MYFQTSLTWKISSSFGGFTRIPARSSSNWSWYRGVGGGDFMASVRVTFAIFWALKEAWRGDARFSAVRGTSRETFCKELHDAHDLIAQDEVLRSYCLPFHAVSRREMFVSLPGWRQLYLLYRRFRKLLCASEDASVHFNLYEQLASFTDVQYL